MAHHETFNSPSRTSDIVRSKHDGNMVMNHVDGEGVLPDIEAVYFSPESSGEKSTAAYTVMKPEHGLYGMASMEESLAALDHSVVYGTRSASSIQKQMKRREVAQISYPAIITAKDALVLNMPQADHNEYDIVLSRRDGETTRASSLVDKDTGVGVYAPQQGDLFHIVPSSVADTMMLTGEDHNSDMHSLKLPYLMMEVTGDMADAMQIERQAIEVKERRVGARRARLDTEAPLRDTTTRNAEADVDTPVPLPRANEEASSLEASSVGSTPAATPHAATLASRLAALDTVGAAPANIDANRAADGEVDTVGASVQDKITQSFEDADGRLARAVARRTKLGIFTTKKRRAQLDRLIQATDKAYARRAGEVDDAQIDAWKADDSLTDQELAEKLVAGYKQREDGHNTRIYEEFRQIKSLGKLSEWHDSLSERYAGLDRKKKIAFGLGAAATVGVLSIPMAGFGAVGAGLMAGAKIYKTYTQSRAGLYTGPQEAQAIATQADSGEVKSLEQLRREAVQHMDQSRAARIENADKVNKKARWTMIGSAALFGVGVVSHIDTVREATAGLRDTVAHWWSDPAIHDTPQLGTDTIGNADGLTTTPEEAVTAPTPAIPEAPTAPAPSPMEFSADASRVDMGEGWYQTFSEMGVTSPAEQAQLLQKVGPELAARGWAYPMADGTYGISRPGALPRDVLELIQKNR